jgi:hypothetical protein
MRLNNGVDIPMLSGNFVPASANQGWNLGISKQPVRAEVLERNNVTKGINIKTFDEIPHLTAGLLYLGAGGYGSGSEGIAPPPIRDVPVQAVRIQTVPPRYPGDAGAGTILYFG